MKVKTVICLVGMYLLTSTNAVGQDSKYSLRDFPNYKIDTVHIQGNPVLMKRHIISIQRHVGIKSAYWDDTDNILTVQYDSKLIGLRDIRNYFHNSLQSKNISDIVKLSLNY